jgi:hypothetical protein
MSNQRPKPILLVFSPLALNIDASGVHKIHDAAESFGNGWLLDVLYNLPADYITATSQVAALKQNRGRDEVFDPGLHQLRQLSWVGKNRQTSTESTCLSFPLPNKVLIPLAVVGQLIQYAEFVNRTCTGYAPRPPEVCHRVVQTLGCCTGLLAAFVASCSQTETQFRIYASAAIRLGMLIGCE